MLAYNGRGREREREWNWHAVMRRVIKIKIQSEARRGTLFSVIRFKKNRDVISDSSAVGPSRAHARK